MEYWPFVGTCGCHSHSKLCHLCNLASLFKLLLPPTLLLYPAHSHPYIHWPDFNQFHEKNHQKLVKISHYLFARLVVQMLIGNQVLLCSVNESNTKARLLFKLNFQNRISQNTGKRKLCGFSLRQLHIVIANYCITDYFPQV